MDPSLLSMSIQQVGASAPTGASGATRIIDASSLAQTQETNPAGEAFRKFVETFQENSADYARDTSAATTDPVAAAKTELTSAPQGTQAAAQSHPVDGIVMMRKSFDHAIFVTLVTQVVSGVSQSTSTLIRQA